MKRRILAAALAVASVASISLAKAAPAQDGSCLESSRLYGWNVVNDRTIIVTDRLHRAYKLSLIPGCYDLKFAFGLAFKPFSQSSLSCMGRGDTVVVPSGGGFPRQTCRVESVTAYTPEMQHADAVNKAMEAPH